ncbi:protein SMALL AUXIN UP-REGULATED RNA 12-like [Nymphaea colorata]|uniref:Uncharacterized protein n=1 Tax=Nymphaea colorata TaxID=210225 RepID=A0A5K1AE35_9MAGN|nr:protein SMALL AUXIN UP-REGULATED RNA 12-like [Nymphaea colorata]
MSGACNANKIRHIVRIRQMLRQWRKKAAAAARISRAFGGGVPADVPAGHLAVYVGKSRRRFVVRASYLNSPAFRALLTQAEEEYGYDHAGPIAIPCDEILFEEILRLIGDGDASVGSRSSRRRPSAISATDELQRRCYDGKFWAESRPLLNGVAERSVV